MQSILVFGGGDRHPSQGAGRLRAGAALPGRFSAAGILSFRAAALSPAAPRVLGCPDAPDLVPRLPLSCSLRRLFPTDKHQNCILCNLSYSLYS